MTKPTYSIKNWDAEFENHESRKLKRVRWVSVPNKHDGKTFRRIARHERAVEIWCAWSLIIEVASKMPVRGVLFDTDGPLDADDLADKTNFPVSIFQIALEVLVDPRFGWMEKQEDYMPPTEDAPSAPVLLTPPAPRVRNAQVLLIDEGELPFDSDEFKIEWNDYLATRREKKKKVTPTAQKRLFKQFREWGEARTIAALRWTIPHDWIGVFEPRIPGAAVQPPMFKPANETPEAQALRENCKRCRGTETEIVPGKGGRPCDHLPTEDEE